MNDFFERLMQYKWRVICTLIGLVFGLVWVCAGFLEALLLAVCVAIGIVIGLILDDKEGFYTVLEKIIPRDRADDDN